jgi:hypothetical protein
MFRRHHLFALVSSGFVGFVLCAASVGCSDPAQATPRVTFDSQVTAGKHPAAMCGKTGTWFTIGSFVKATAQLTGATGGSVSMFGHVATSGESPNVTVNLTKLGETFKSDACIVTYDTVAGQAVAAGRIWANVDCADANNAQSQQLCTSHVQIRLENCAQ